jgi:hypothetical protein
MTIFAAILSQTTQFEGSNKCKQRNLRYLLCIREDRKPPSEFCGCPMNLEYPAGLDAEPDYMPTTADTKACTFYNE